MSEQKKSANNGQVVIEMPNFENSKTFSNGSFSKDSSEPQNLRQVDSPDRTSALPSSCPSPEISRFYPSPSSNKPPKIPTNETLIRKRSLTRSIFSKPKSRFGEQSYPVDLNALDDNGKERDAQVTNSPNNSKGVARTVSIGPITPKTPLMASPGGGGGGGEDDEEEIYKKVNRQLSIKKKKKVKTKVLVEWVTFTCILGCLIASLTVNELEHYVIWGLEIWKWCVLIMVTFCGMLVTHWFIHFLVFLIEKNFLLRKKVLYFVHGLKNSVQVFIWLCLVLIAWILVFKRGVKRSEAATNILNYVTWTIVTFQIGAFLWLVKNLLLKILASTFHVTTFFDRIQESVFHQYVLQILSGPPIMEMAEKVGRVPSTGVLSFTSLKKGKEKKEKKVIDMGKIHQMKQEKVSAWTMKVLVDVISSSGLSTISNVLDESVDDGEGEQADKEITNEMEAIAAAYHIFRNVAQPGCNYIDEEDLMRFMIKEEVDLVFPLMEGSNKGRIDRKALTDWVVKVYQGRKALAHALNDTKTAVKQLNKLVTGILIVVIVIIWLLLMEIATTKVLVLLSSQLVVVAFIFGNTCKTIFEAIIFVFVMHPFDVGDRCVIDGTQLIVEEMNILTTVFLKFDNEKIYYPNSVLATKAIGNFYRSPDMGDSTEFSIDFKTPVEKIGALKEKIKKYLEKNSQHWHPNHNMVVKEIENVNKIKMALFFNHTMNFQDYGEKSRRKTELVIELKKIFEELAIRYDLLPQEVLLRQGGSATATTAANK